VSEKNTELSAAYDFEPVAVETNGPMDDCSAGDLGRKISERSGDQLEAQFLFQRISVLLQRSN